MKSRYVLVIIVSACLIAYVAGCRIACNSQEYSEAEWFFDDVEHMGLILDIVRTFEWVLIEEIFGERHGWASSINLLPDGLDSATVVTLTDTDKRTLYISAVRNKFFELPANVGNEMPKYHDGQLIVAQMRLAKYERKVHVEIRIGATGEANVVTSTYLDSLYGEQEIDALWNVVALLRALSSGGAVGITSCQSTNE